MCFKLGMKTEKKDEVAYVGKYRGVILQIGLVVVLCIVFFIIEWDSQTPKSKNNSPASEEPAKKIEFSTAPPDEDKSLPQPLELVPYEVKVEDSNVTLEDEIKINPNVSQDFVARPIELPQRPPKEEKVKEEKALVTAEQMPLFNGGSSNAFRDWIQRNLKYPEIASENGICGNVLIAFAVNSKGEVCDVKVLRGIDPSLDREAVRIVSSSPKWVPGKQDGKNVKVIFNVTVKFVLQN